MRPFGLGGYSAPAMRIIGSVLLIAIGFVGGFYAGLEVHDKQIKQHIRDNPMAFLTEYKEDFMDVARSSGTRYGEAWEHVKKAVGSLSDEKEQGDAE